MSDSDDFEFFRLRKAAKTYISKVFKFQEVNAEPLRHVKMVLEGSDSLLVGELEGVLCLRLTGNVRKTQVSALVSQDNHQIRRLTLQTFKEVGGNWTKALHKDEFTFRSDEFERLLRFLDQIRFIDLSNQDNFQIEDISTKAGPKAIIDASDRDVLKQLKDMPEDQRNNFLRALQQSLTHDEINILLGRKQGLAEYEEHIRLLDWKEAQWQDFFDRQQWVFGYGLDYRVLTQFDREMTVGGGGTDNKNKPVIDFLMSFTDYTVLVEIKTPDTPLFSRTKRGRSGTWELSREFTSAVSQVLEQKAEWLSFAQTGEHFNKQGDLLQARTRSAKTILVIGSKDQFIQRDNSRDERIMRDTFELFRRECRSIDIVTFDELLSRARFITKSR